jgi:hypothetical protein
MIGRVFWTRSCLLLFSLRNLNRNRRELGAKFFSLTTMAKPPSETPDFTLSSSPDFGPSGRRSSGIRKRTRESELINDIIEHPRKHAQYTCTEDSYKTRRVNPERLALRLDPGLVAEMDALIIPGAKMPTFSVRKDFQERYKVDRRHIYDYFHSRGVAHSVQMVNVPLTVCSTGLRVAKEDKHNNLTRTLSLKARRLPTKVDQLLWCSFTRLTIANAVGIL